MTAEPQLLKLYVRVIPVVLASAGFGWWIDRLESNRMTRFRDKSALYGRELKPGEPPSWP